MIRGLVTGLGLACACLLAPEKSAAVNVLQPWDAQLYAGAFDATARGAFGEADQQIATLADETLMGYVLADRYLHKDYLSSYDELLAWLQRYADHPQAERIYKLALRKRPPGAAPPPAPNRLAFEDLAKHDPIWDDDPGHRKQRTLSATAKKAEAAFYEREDKTAYHLAQNAGHHWIAGLSAYRLGQFSAALRHFEALSMDENTGSWMRSGAAFWAARAAIAAGEPRLAPDFLRLAARWPLTFYGQIAERQLGLESGTSILNQHTGLSDGELNRLSRIFPQARRAAALMQTGRDRDAAQEIHLAIALASSSERNSLERLGAHFQLPGFGARAGTVKNRAELLARYPIPDYTPMYGFHVDRALVFAVARQESRFRTDAVSPSGARGVMQLLPTTAAWISGNASLNTTPEDLYDPAYNLHVGQLYLRHLMETVTPRQDLIRTVASYNAGPGAFGRWTKAFDQDDVLMIIESLPSSETRDYVEKVMANYWIYRQILGQTTPTLDAMAAGVPAIFTDQDGQGPDAPTRVAAR